MDGKEFPGPVNADIVKKYYAWGHRKKDLSELKTRKGGFGRKRKRKKEKNEKWKEKWKKKMLGQVENPKGRLDYEKDI